jgi:hypothetical protein
VSYGLINIFTPSELRLFVDHTALLTENWSKSTTNFKSDRDIACQNQPAHSVMARFIVLRNKNAESFDEQRNFVVFGYEAPEFRTNSDTNSNAYTAVRQAVEQYDPALLLPRDVSLQGVSSFLWQGYLKPEALSAAIRAETSLQEAEKKCVEPATVIRRLILQAIDRRESLRSEKEAQIQEQKQGRLSTVRSRLIRQNGIRGLRNEIRNRLETLKKRRPIFVEDIPQSAGVLMERVELETVDTRLFLLKSQRTKIGGAYQAATTIAQELPDAARPQVMHTAKNVRRISTVYDRIDAGIDALAAYAEDLTATFNRKTIVSHKRPRALDPIALSAAAAGGNGALENRRNI